MGKFSGDKLSNIFTFLFSLGLGFHWYHSPTGEIKVAGKPLVIG